MKKESNSGSLIIIILILVISLPPAIWGVTAKIMKALEPPEEVVIEDKSFNQNGILHFYSYGTLVGTYTCTSGYLYCGYVLETIDDDTYGLNYYNDKQIDTIELINGKYAFIVDTTVDEEYYRSSPINLIDVTTNEVKGTYNAVKNYTMGLVNDLYIVKNNFNKWGVLQIKDTGITQIIPFEYDYIGVRDEIDETLSLLKSDRFVVTSSSNNYIIDNNNIALTNKSSNKITDYNSDSYISKSDFTLSFLNYSGNNYLNISSGINSAKYVNNYISIVDRYNYYAIYDYHTNKMISPYKQIVSGMDTVSTTKLLDGSTEIYASGRLLYTIDQPVATDEITDTTNTLQ